MTFIKGQKFSYTTPLEDDISKLIETAKKERYYEQLGKELNELSARVQSSKANDVVNNKSEIIEILREQIGFHYDQYEGQAAVTLEHDNAILEARKVLKDSAMYHKLLSAN